MTISLRYNIETQKSWRKKTIFIVIGISLILCLVVYFVFFNKKDSEETEWKPNYYRNSPLREYENGGAVCSDANICSKIGRDMLLKTGNAVDAAISDLFCTGLLVMQSKGIGGGFVMVVYNKENRNATSIFAREIAPLHSSKDMFKANSDLSKEGGLACGIPGELKGYLKAHELFGSNATWHEIIEPTYNICMNGYRMSVHQYDAFQLRYKQNLNDPLLRTMFIDPKTNKTKPAGSLIKPPSNMCKTYKRLMDEGPDSFYKGSLAADFVKDVQELGGIITEEDMHTYTTRVSDPTTVSLKGNLTLYSSPLPASGPLLGFILKVMEGLNISASDLKSDEAESKMMQKIIETYKHAFALRTHLGDPYYTNEENEVIKNIKQILNKLSSETYINEIRSRIFENQTSNNADDYGDGLTYVNSEDHGTSHLTVIGPNGDAVSVTSTVNVFFGASRLGKRTGILLNSGMDDFSNPGFVNYFGLEPSPANYIVPLRSAFSSMTPAVIVDSEGAVKMAVGAAGGPMITTSTAMTIMQHLWLKEDLKTSIDSKRFHHQLLPMQITYERGASKEIVRRLQNIGHKLIRTEARISVVCALSQTEEHIYGNADFRKEGAVCGYSVTNNGYLTDQEC